MLLKYFYDDKLAHASYLVGCQRANVALIVDPGRDIEQYLAAAKSEGMEITAIAETHIHADYVSGARELAERVNAKLYVSDEGPSDWKYQYASQYDHQLLHDGDEFLIGNLKFTVMHTPGHTPESLSFLLTDMGGGADLPMGIFTGDFVFVGSIGRPDLLEEAAGIADTAEPGARDLFASIERFRALPDYLQVWPAHGAGSACGKGLGAIPSSTVGYEKRFNPALQYQDEQEFVRYILADQPEAPKYFAVMKRVNKEGPKVLGPDHRHQMLSASKIEDAIATGNVVDLRSADAFAEAHVPGSINIPVGMLAGWAGWLLDYAKPTYLITGEETLEEAARVLHKIGCDQIAGGFDARELIVGGHASESYRNQSVDQLSEAVLSGKVTLLDVRSADEWNAGHIENARHHFLGRLPDTVTSVSADQPVVVQCRSGARSAIAASVLQAAGIKKVTNLTGGYMAWKSAGLPTTTQDKSVPV
ncbi:MBL fold metallo-hydrolase [Crateriforma conspicua]|uniref:MBL fold metallo-hydrolase n=1 Tax=Crateriforma conspicua TaxID=2527996 RepID=UPI00118A893D|nr:MBL fold metallo-hydrolase [Crateriforma conspicua]QDV65217.1 Beta-lactamase hydrolase-like protein [Crateriforma conspicua]